MTEHDLQRIETACRMRAEALGALCDGGPMTVLSMGDLGRLTREIRRLWRERTGKPTLPAFDPWGDGR